MKYSRMFTNIEYTKEVRVPSYMHPKVGDKIDSIDPYSNDRLSGIVTEEYCRTIVNGFGNRVCVHFFVIDEQNK